ncbi:MULTISPECIES: restriction endonuclease subunit S [unclassified Pseudoalteromonas]|uniref:restriction endonuclease subunit S n=1 Tax=unclassified Pseudoalteromonas TaxID=194690 RepID=UPI0023590343|nr:MULTISPECIES: restriction endonuclease subunit S [unclassified Pseudoalteromonas]MDC9563305.1 restriction endonuclease subunit S [Pseudoalteromonas sp. GAB2316C]MDC9567680.1 restriction endonuclease subunit S [Pseudoalteromonas sp. GABNB9D]MDC9571957.1 restriction endonuclease subunit S [Pseudoalteromonas sp. GABNS16A]MDC9576370.1 restriction endonuclease subunit S [Pseudoalteromonas sp. GABNS16E]MDC9583752.1 restriction endonuclease subunit S [Pseudoalteromonas sp. GABNS16C]
MVPNGWTLTSLGNLCEINPKKIKKPENGKVSFIAMNQLSEEGQLISHLPREYEEVSKGFTSFKDGDVLVAKITPCFENGKGALVLGLTNGVGFGSTEFHVLRAKENTSPEFIYYLTRTKELRVRGENNMQGSAGHRRVTADYFNTYKVLTPPLPEQRKIAKILSTWDKAISTTERLIDNSKQQKKALMQQLLTGAHTQRKRLLDDSGKPFEGEWEEKRLSELGDISSGGTPSTKQPEYWDGDINWVTPTDITKQDSIYIESTARLVSMDGIKNSSAKLLPKGTLLVCTRATIGEMAIARHEMSTNQGFKNIVPNENTNIEFVYYLLNFYKHKLISKASGSTFLELSKSAFEGLHFYVPEYQEQKKIAAVLLNADREIDALQQQLADLKQEKKALMQQLLIGKKRVLI